MGSTTHNFGQWAACCFTKSLKKRHYPIWQISNHMSGWKSQTVSFWQPVPSISIPTNRWLACLTIPLIRFSKHAKWEKTSDARSMFRFWNFATRSQGISSLNFGYIWPEKDNTGLHSYHWHVYTGSENINPFLGSLIKFSNSDNTWQILWRLNSFAKKFRCSLKGALQYWCLTNVFF